MVSLIEQIESRVRQTTHDQIRGLSIEEIHGQVIIRGHVSTYHAKQLALHGALELLSGDHLRDEIAVLSSRLIPSRPPEAGTHSRR
jgi:hypothetical protein